jgi:hypothetical protein
VKKVDGSYWIWLIIGYTVQYIILSVFVIQNGLYRGSRIPLAYYDIPIKIIFLAR